MAIRPLHDSFLFVFIDDTGGGKFIPKTRSGILLTNQQVNEQTTSPRWGKVLAVGAEIKDFGVNDYVLLEPLQWTMGFTYDDVRIWKSDASRVLAVAGADVPVQNLLI